MNSERVKLWRKQSNEKMNDRGFISLALRLEAATEREDSSECDVAWNIEKSSLVSKSETNTQSELQDVWKRLLLQDMIDLYKRDLYR